MQVSVAKLRIVLGNLFDAGYHSDDLNVSLEETKQLFAEELAQGDYSGLSSAFLRLLPDGAIFEHPERGRCWIETRKDEKRLMFVDGGAIPLNGTIDIKLKKIYHA